MATDPASSQNPPTVSSEFAANPSEAPTEICDRLFKGKTTRFPGNWGPQEPSALFLQIYNDARACLDEDPLCGMVSPPLMGSHGTIPLTVIAPLADIVRHMSNLIVRAEREVILITCSWSPSVGSHLISDALKELSVRAGRRQERVVVKVMYDKAGPAQMMNPRQHVKPDVYAR